MFHTTTVYFLGIPLTLLMELPGVVKIVKFTLKNKCKTLCKWLLRFILYHWACLQHFIWNIKVPLLYTTLKLIRNFKLHWTIHCFSSQRNCHQVRPLPSAFKCAFFSPNLLHLISYIFSLPLTLPLMQSPHTINQLSEVQT